MEKLLNEPITEILSSSIATLVVSSPAFDNNEIVPEKYTFKGENINPPLKIENLPVATHSLALIVEDMDERNKLCTHWIVWNIHPTHFIAENSVPGLQGLNDFGERNYEGPCPPKGLTRYFFRIYALDCMLTLKGPVKRKELETAMKNHVLACGQLMGKYNWHC